MLHRSRTTPRTLGGRRYNTDKLLAEIVHAYIALYDRGQYRGKTKAKKQKQNTTTQNHIQPKTFSF